MDVKTDETSQGGAPSTVLDWIGLAAAACVVLGPLLGWLRIIAAEPAFRIYGAGGIFALIAGLSALVQAARGRGFGPGRIAALLAGMVFIVTLAARGGSGPMTNDFTTSLDDPPAFQNALTIAANQGRDMSHKAEDAEIQREWYPDLAPARLAMPAGQAFELALSTARSMPTWTVLWDDPTAGQIEAVAVTQVFGFHDDIAIRVRADGSGSLLDVRSKSRDGKGDLGANEARIRAYLAAVESAK